MIAVASAGTLVLEQLQMLCVSPQILYNQPLASAYGKLARWWDNYFLHFRFNPFLCRVFGLNIVKIIKSKDNGVAADRFSWAFSFCE